MEPGEKGVWKYETSEDLHGVYYDYEVVIDGERNRTGDPYAKGAGINGQAQHGGGFKEDGSLRLGKGQTASKAGRKHCL